MPPVRPLRLRRRAQYVPKPAGSDIASSRDTLPRSMIRWSASELVQLQPLRLDRLHA
jgi:hypothetical protein